MCKKPCVSWLRKNKNRPPAEADSLSLTEKLTLDVEPFLEALNTSACIDELLLAREERMAVRANFNADVFFCRTGHKSIAACACNSRPLILGMDSLFHLYLTSHNLTNIQQV